MNEIKKAMEKFGFRAGTVVSVSKIRFSRTTVFVNGAVFGVWDFSKNTFVD